MRLLKEQYTNDRDVTGSTGKRLIRACYKDIIQIKAVSTVSEVHRSAAMNKEHRFAAFILPKLMIVQYQFGGSNHSRGIQCRPMEHKDVQAYLKHNQENQTDFDDPYQEYYQKQYETNYEMRVNDNRKLPNYVFSFALPGDGVGQRRQKVKILYSQYSPSEVAMGYALGFDVRRLHKS